MDGCGIGENLSKLSTSFANFHRTFVRKRKKGFCTSLRNYYTAVLLVLHERKENARYLAQGVVVEGWMGCRNENTFINGQRLERAPCERTTKSCLLLGVVTLRLCKLAETVHEFAINQLLDCGDQ